MRVLILSAVLAFAAAAPSGNLLLVQPVAFPAVVPTISPGDIQAAAIDAQVKAQDLARAAADKAQELADQAVENSNEKVVTDVTIAQEKNLEAFWSAEDKKWQAEDKKWQAEDKKWQAVDALKTAEAQLDGAVAKNADALAKSALGGPYIVGTPAIAAPVVASPIAPVVYTPYIDGLDAAAKTTQTEVRTEIKEEEKLAAVKTAEPEKAEAAQPIEQEKPAEESPATQSPAVKALENLEAKPALAFAPALNLAQPVITPILANGLALAPAAGVYKYNFAIPAVGPVLAQPVVNYATSVQQLHGVVAPTLVKTVW